MKDFIKGKERKRDEKADKKISNKDEESKSSKSNKRKRSISDTSGAQASTTPTSKKKEENRLTRSKNRLVEEVEDVFNMQAKNIVQQAAHNKPNIKNKKEKHLIETSTKKKAPN